MKIHESDVSTTSELKNLVKLVPTDKEIIFACIGTDRSTGDSLGPLVGTQLEKLGYHVLGTLEHPLHALNLEERMTEVNEKYPDHFVLAIDACLGNSHSIGDILVQPNGLYPGKAVGKDFPMVGNACIKGIVNIGGYMEYQVLQSTRLHLVYTMSNLISDACHRMMVERKPLLSPSVSEKGKRWRRVNPFRTFLGLS